MLNPVKTVEEEKVEASANELIQSFAKMKGDNWDNSKTDQMTKDL